MGVTKMKSYDVTAVYNTGQTLIIKHTSLDSALQTITVLYHNAKIDGEEVNIIKEWEK